MKKYLLMLFSIGMMLTARGQTPSLAPNGDHQNTHEMLVQQPESSSTVTTVTADPQEYVISLGENTLHVPAWTMTYKEDLITDLPSGGGVYAFEVPDAIVIYPVNKEAAENVYQQFAGNIWTYKSPSPAYYCVFTIEKSLKNKYLNWQKSMSRQPGNQQYHKI